MPWKKKKVGDVEVIETNDAGDPIWINGDNKEAAIQGDTVTRLNGEARQHRLDKEKAEQRLAAFGDLDPEKAKKALETVSLLDQSKLIEAGKVEELKNTMRTEFQTRLDQANAETTKLKEQIKTTALQAAFASSEFVRGKLTLTPDLVQNLFGNRFDLRDGKVVGLDVNGNPMISGKNMGENATFDEAIEALISTHPAKASLLKGANNSGTGNNGGGGGDGNKRTLTRAQEAALTQQDRVAFFDQVNKGTAELVD